MIRSMVALSLLLSTTIISAHSQSELEREISTIEVFEVTEHQVALKDNQLGRVEGGSTGTLPLPTPKLPSLEERLEKTGKVIATAKDIVALGEAIYELVKKGKPSNTTEYAPISVIPKDLSGEPADIFDMENFSFPTEKKYVTVVKNGAGKEVVRFEYMVIFSYGGSYNGSGKYITGANIIPVSVKTNYGWDFSATMKLSGIMNHGSRSNPVAGAMLTVKYQMNAWSNSFERNDTIHITGDGRIKTYNRK
jgi:hypothetical protein